MADGCSLFRNEDRQMVFTDLTFLMASLLRVANSHCGELRDRMVLCISLPSSFLHLEEGGDAELQLVQLFWKGVNMVPG